jgi:hypothetical protein
LNLGYWVAERYAKTDGVPFELKRQNSCNFSRLMSYTPRRRREDLEGGDFAGGLLRFGDGPWSYRNLRRSVWTCRSLRHCGAAEADRLSVSDIIRQGVREQPAKRNDAQRRRANHRSK